MNKKILFVLSNNLFVRNYIRTKVFDRLFNQFDCELLVNQNINFKNEVAKINGFKGFYQNSEKYTLIHSLIFNALTIKYSDRSTSFAYRLRRTLPALNFLIIKPYWRIPLRLMKFLFFSSLIRFMRSLLRLSFVNSLYLKFLKKILKPNKFLKSFILKGKYDLVVLPSSAYESEAIDIVSISEETGCKVALLIDNWDNLSSKTVLWKKPHFVCVWGEQSKKHAINIQGIPAKNVFVIGTPRTDHYFSLRNSKLPSPFKFPYVLFVGTAVNFDEEGLVRNIDKVISKNKHIWPKLKLVYRPHPWRQNISKIEQNLGENVLVDPQLSSNLGDKTTGFQPDLQYYPNLIANSEIIMGGFTSMLIESMIFYKKFLVFAHADKRYVTNMKDFYEGLEHFRGLEKLDNILFSFSESDIEEKFLSLWVSRDDVHKKKFDKDRNWFLFDDNTRYQDRLVNVISEMLKSE